MVIRVFFLVLSYGHSLTPSEPPNPSLYKIQIKMPPKRVSTCKGVECSSGGARTREIDLSWYPGSYHSARKYKKHYISILVPKGCLYLPPELTFSEMQRLWNKGGSSSRKSTFYSLIVATALPRKKCKKKKLNTTNVQRLLLCFRTEWYK